MKEKERHAQRQKAGRGRKLKELEVRAAEGEKRQVSLRETKQGKKKVEIQ